MEASVKDKTVNDEGKPTHMSNGEEIGYVTDPGCINRMVRAGTAVGVIGAMTAAQEGEPGMATLPMQIAVLAMVAGASSEEEFMKNVEVQCEALRLQARQEEAWRASRKVHDVIVERTAELAGILGKGQTRQ